MSCCRTFSIFGLCFESSSFVCKYAFFIRMRTSSSIIWAVCSLYGLLRTKSPCCGASNDTWPIRSLKPSCAICKHYMCSCYIVANITCVHVISLQTLHVFMLHLCKHYMCSCYIIANITCVHVPSLQILHVFMLSHWNVSKCITVIMQSIQAY